MKRCFSAAAACHAICLLSAGCVGNRAGSDSKPRGSAGSGRSCGTTGNPAGINTFENRERQIPVRGSNTEFTKPEADT